MQPIIINKNLLITKKFINLSKKPYQDAYQEVENSKKKKKKDNNNTIQII